MPDKKVTLKALRSLSLAGGIVVQSGNDFEVTQKQAKDLLSQGLASAVKPTTRKASKKNTGEKRG